MHPVMQMQQQVPSPRHFEHLRPFHEHLKPEQFAALQQQQHQQHQQQLQQMQHFQQHQHQQHQHQQQQHQLQSHYQYLSQSRAARPQSASAPTSFGSTPNSVPQQSFPIRSTQPTGLTTSNQNSQPSDLHTLGHHAHAGVHFAPAGSAVARNPTAYPLAAERFQEHHLRRKTPNGTIDAGYDGSHAGLATGPPPLKQMAMSASSRIFPTPVISQNARQAAAAAGNSTNSWSMMTPTGASSTSTNEAANASAANMANAGNFSMSAILGGQASAMRAAAADAMLAQQMQQLQQSHEHQRANGGMANGGNAYFVQPDIFSPSYQASPGPTAFNSPSFDSQSLWSNSALLQGYQPQSQPFLLPNMRTPGTNIPGNMANSNGSLGNLGLVPQNIACDSAFISAAQPMFSPPGIHHDGIHQLVVPPAHQAAAMDSFRSSTSQAQALALAQAQAQAQANMAAHPESNTSNDINMTSPNALPPAVPSLDSMAGASGALGAAEAAATAMQGLALPGDSPNQVKEQVLAHAEKAYSDLLYCLLHTKKSINGRPMPNLRPRNRPNVYAKVGQPPQQHQQQQQQQQKQAQEFQMRQSQAQAQAYAQAQIQAQAALATSDQLGSHVQQGMQAAGAARIAQINRYQQAIQKGYGFNSTADMNALQVPLVMQAKAVLEVISSLSEQDNWKWIEGMLLGACLYYALENFELALEWFKRIYALRPDFIEVLSNIAATLHCLDRREEAIKYWFHAVRTKPSYLESAEHLTAVLSSAQRHRDAVEVITLVQNSLRMEEKDNSPTSGEGATDNTHVKTDPVEGSDSSKFVPASNDAAKDKQPDSPNNTGSQPGFGSSGYAIPAHDNGRMLGLVHMKANILYALKDIAAASDAYEEAVLISVGRPIRSVQDLIRKIRGALSTDSPTPDNAQSFPLPSSGPPLLAPEIAKLTSARTFPHTNGQLPGLHRITDIFQLKAAIATASNALLSMAKILQDAMATSSYAARGGGNQSTAVGDILSLYYLSMSLQESPSTANNVGILLASVQQAPVPKSHQAQKQAEAATQQQKLALLHQRQQLHLRQQLQIQHLRQQQLLKTPQQIAQRQAQQMQQIQKLQQLQKMQQMQQLRSGLQLNTGGATNSTAVEALAIPAGITPGSSLALAFAYYNYGLKLDPKHVHLHTNLGSLLKDVGHLDLAIKMYEQAVSCDGTFDIALTNLANAVKDRGRVSEAIMYYRRAVTSNPEFTEAVCGLSTALNSVCDWAGRGGVVLYNGRFDRWHVDENGMLKDVRKFNFVGSGLMQRVVNIVARQLKEASLWGQGILHESQIAMLASQMKEAAGSADGDASSAGSALAIRDQLDGLDVAAELQKWAGQPWEGSRVLRLIERATRVVMRRWYYDRYILGVESSKGYARPRAPASLSVPGAPTVLPFHTFTCPLPAKEVRLISQRNALRISSSTLRMPWLSASVYPPPAPPKPHLNIGYISSDFNNHPLAHLMQSVFGFHDQTRAKAFCYATTASDKSVHRQKIEREAPVFRDVTNWPAERLIEQIIQDGIHILVNLNGYTRGARNEIFAARPAPIQMSFMGFAGTLGAEWCDYLLADTMAVPPSTLRPWRGNVSIGDVFHDEAALDEEKWIYSENLIYSRDTFFCCDHKQSADPSERALTWKDEMQRRWKMRKELFPNLSDDTIILGNFNQLYKIDPTTFRSWLRILANVPKAVLWLLRFPDLGETNLRKTAVLWGNQSIADRIIFTDVAPKHLHITRARVCDLFLDTPECNAHTTAADVLWSSTPVVTLPRYEYKMCSRIGASVLKGALPKDAQGQQAASELIADDEDQYEKLAIKLANSLSYRLVQSETSLTSETYGEGSGRLAEIRQLLWQHKWSCGLFDTKRWVSDLEDAYDAAWGNWVSGKRGDIYL